MKASDYIASGILDLYVLGGLSAQEEQVVETLAQEHTEIAQEIEQLREAIEKMAFQEARTPSASVKQKLFETIESKIEKVETPVRPLSSWSWSLAASWAAILLLAGTSVYYRSLWQNTQTRLLALETQNSALTQDFNLTKYQRESAENQLALVQDTSFKAVALKAVPNKEGFARVYWNKESGLAFVHARYLPATPEGKQYQLWAIVDGKPVDMGMISSTSEQTIFKMKGVKNASAFAITLEKEGGSPAPTLEEMFVMGAV